MDHMHDTRLVAEFGVGLHDDVRRGFRDVVVEDFEVLSLEEDLVWEDLLA
jgi:hypothetical protein